MIPIYKPYIGSLEKKYVNKCLNDGWISSRGEYIDIFESKLADYLNVKHAISVSNGTVSLMLILRALGLGPGDKILVPSLTYAATISSPNMLGIRCILFDSLQNYQPSFESMVANFCDDVKAILLPELYGNATDIDKFVDFCITKKIHLIEDSAETFGCKLNGRSLGTFGVAGSFSFFGNKTITTGEGGAVVTNDDDLADKMRRLKNQSHIGNFIHDGPGFNFRMTNIQAAIGVAQLSKINEINTKKQKIAKFYNENLSQKIIRVPASTGISSTEWMPLFRLDEEKKYSQLYSFLIKNGIDSRPCFTPIHMMNGFDIIHGDLPIASEIYGFGFNLPCYPGLRKDELKYIVKNVNEFVESFK